MTDATRDRSFWLVLAAALIAGALLRFWGVSELELTQWDEGPYVGWGMGVAPYDGREPLSIYAPPLVPVVNRLALPLFGNEPRTGIYTAALFSVLGILAVAYLTRRLFGPRAGAAAAVLMAFDPLAIAYGKTALTEAAFTTLTVTTVLWLARAFERRDAVSAVVAGIFAGLSVMTKYHGFFPLVAATLVAVLEVARDALRKDGDALATFRCRFRTMFLVGLGFLPFFAATLWFIDADMGLAAFRGTRATWVNGIYPWTILATLSCIAETFAGFGLPALIPLAAIGVVAALLHRNRGFAIAPLAVLVLILVAYRSYTRLLVPVAALSIPLAALVIARIRERWTLAPRSALPAAFIVTFTAIVVMTGAFATSETMSYRSDAYVRAARMLEQKLREAPGAVICVAQQAIYPYLSPDAAARCFTITEPEAATRLESGEYRYILTDRRLDHHFRVAPYLERDGARLETVSVDENPLRGPILYDRVGSEAYALIRDPGTLIGSTDLGDLVHETTIRLIEKTERP